MKLKFGAIVTDGRGKVGGHVLSKNRAGAYLRTKVTPVNPSTTFQATVRNRLVTNAQAWKGLTQGQRNAWNASVALFAKTDIFGDKKNPSGFNLYCSLNNNLSMIGASSIAVPPINTSVLTTNFVTLTAAKGTPALTLTMSAVVPAGTNFVVRATVGSSAGKNFFKSEFRNISVVAPAGTAVQSLLTPYETKFGTIAAAGQKITVQGFFVNATTGVQSGRFIASAIITA